MNIKYNSFLLFFKEQDDCFIFKLSEQQVNRIELDYFNTLFEIIYYRKLSECPNYFIPLFIEYYVNEKKFALYYWDKQKGFLNLILDYPEEEYINLSKLFKKLYNDYKI